jgi:hypothetical protein
VLEADGKAWADGDIRIGEYILIIDSDTRVVSSHAPGQFASPSQRLIPHSPSTAFFTVPQKCSSPPK